MSVLLNKFTVEMSGYSQPIADRSDLENISSTGLPTTWHPLAFTSSDGVAQVWLHSPISKVHEEVPLRRVWDTCTLRTAIISTRSAP